MARKYKLSLIIPVFNEENYLPRFLSSLANQDANPNTYFCIFVDNNCTDRSIHQIKYFYKNRPDVEIKIIEEKKQGIDYARRKGMDTALSKTDILAATDVDCELPKDFISSLQNIFSSNKGVDVVAGKVSWHPKVFIGMQPELKLLLRKRNILQSIIWEGFGQDLYGGYFAMSKDIYIKIGRWPTLVTKTNRLRADDFEASRKLHAVGAKFVKSKNIVIYSDRRLHRNLLSFISEKEHLGPLKHTTTADRRPPKKIMNKALEWAIYSSINQYSNRILEYFAQFLSSDCSFKPSKKFSKNMNYQITHFLNTSKKTIIKTMHQSNISNDRDSIYNYLVASYNKRVSNILMKKMKEQILTEKL